MTAPVILFVTHRSSQCGVYGFGENVFDAIRASTKYRFVKAECESLTELAGQVARHRPRAIIYNYMPATMPWVASYSARGRLLFNHVAPIPVTQIGVIHSILQPIADEAVPGKLFKRAHPELANRLFDYYIAPDPTLLLKNSLVYKTGRPVPKYTNRFPLPSKLTIGSFGFAKTGYDDLIALVQSEFDEAVIRLSIPFATFGDADGAQARAIADRCRSLVRKPGISLSISHDYLDQPALLDFLAQNTINVFLRDRSGRGISSVIDFGLAVGRPMAISDSPMFKHITEAPIVVGKRSLRAIIDDGMRPLERYVEAWTPQTLCWDYERILDSIFARRGFTPLPFSVDPLYAAGLLRRMGVRGFLGVGSDVANSHWLDTSIDNDQDEHRTPVANASYVPVKLDGERRLNRLLGDDARRLYAPAEAQIGRLVPHTFARKLPEANVQQAFVFDTVYRHLAAYNQPRVLCVGGFEDTACMALTKLGVDVEEIDPVYNYTLQEFVTKPTTRRGTYDIIFSTSVIEHDPDDRSFVEAVESLLAPDGLFVMTCDYRDGWRPGDSKPCVDARLYTREDLERRLLSHMKNCAFVDEGNHWTAPTSDVFAAQHEYAFATFCVRKRAVDRCATAGQP
jgi:SAM-dependent methyltransferase